MKRSAISLSLSLLAAILAASAGAQAQPRGPMSFSAIDANGDGAITKTEFDHFRAMRQKQAATQGRMMRNAGNRPSFSMIDANGDGKITRAEFDRFRASRMRRNNR